jgi:2-C-methyl-D-erythritol 4-phosphate cytidylyltransferase
LIQKFLYKMSRKPCCAAVIVAAGRASRMQGADKILSEIHGDPVIAHTVRVFQQCSQIREIVVVPRQDLLEQLLRVLLRQQQQV